MYRYGLFHDFMLTFLSQHKYLYFTIDISVHVTCFIRLMILKRKKERKELGGRVPLLINWNHDAPESITKPNTKQGKSLSHPTYHDLSVFLRTRITPPFKHQLAATQHPPWYHDHHTITVPPDHDRTTLAPLRTSFIHEHMRMLSFDQNPRPSPRGSYDQTPPCTPLLDRQKTRQE